MACLPLRSFRSNLQFVLLYDPSSFSPAMSTVAATGGRLGVANDRTAVGIPNERIFAEMDGIVNSISDACAPKIPVDLGVENIDGKAVIVLDVLAGVHG